MAETQPGFTVNGKFYPLVSIDDWRHDDFKLARRLTDLGPMQLASTEADEVLVKTAAAAVAFFRENTEVPLDKIEKFFGSLKPSDIEPSGFETEKEDDPKDEAAGSPRSETPSDSSLSSTEPSTDASLEK